MIRERLIKERTNRKLTQKQVAKILDISEVYVRKIEKGDCNPGRGTMLKFEKLYCVRDRDLFPELFNVYVDIKCINYQLA